MRRYLIAVIAILLVAAAPSPPSGSERSRPDPREPFETFLDLQRIYQVREGEQIVFGLSTYEPWLDAALWGQDTMILMLFSTDADAHYERWLVVDQFDPGPVTTVRAGQGRIVGVAVVGRPDDRSIEVRSDKAAFGASAPLFWHVMVTASSACEGTCSGGCPEPTYRTNTGSYTTCYDGARLGPRPAKS